MAKKIITVNELYQNGYRYVLQCPAGKQFQEGFTPELTPSEMLKLGIFGGDYFQEVPKEFPSAWFRGVELSHGGGSQAQRNFFGVLASQSLAQWQQKGWIYDDDPLGWFLWYCRYYLGRRIQSEDERQIKRWKNMRRHVAQIKKHCCTGDQLCRRKQRQALLHWAYDSRKL